jgi:hypothetical protein
MADASWIIIAECPACSEQRFRAPREAPESRDILTCDSCGLKLTYGFLQARMGAAVGRAPAANDGPKHKGKRKAPVRPRQRKRG